MSSDQDMAAVVIFNTRAKNEALAKAAGVTFTFEHVTIMLGLARPNADRVLELEKILDGNCVEYLVKSFNAQNAYYAKLISGLQ